MKRFKDYLQNEVLDLKSGSEEEAIRKAFNDFKKSDKKQFQGKSDAELSKMAFAAVKSARNENAAQLSNNKIVKIAIASLARRGIKVDTLNDLADLELPKQSQALDFLVRALRTTTDPVQTIKLRDELRTMFSLKVK